ncbi:AMP-dependent synthetase [Erythrobacter litoralis]|uniref:AMP-binding protein n=1 Tax=Erythrobacter litoralis TaxID=39960 RepID=UPI002434D21F|nr:AMP-binding protein [Erythrobacter litoralis]MDG6078078.1 AMP-dependent synthetase [Erythrobacter litoralis]
MTPGSLQSYGLTVDKFLDHAAKWHPKAEIVTAGEDGAVDRAGYEDVRARSQGLSARLAELGIGYGDTVATLAWNSRAHVETWFAIMGMGAVCQTLNPRLTASVSAAMVRQAGVRLLVASADLADLARNIAEDASEIEAVLIIDGAQATLPPFEALADARIDWGDFDELSPCGLCFTSGTTGDPKGVTYTHRGNYLHTLRLLQANVAAICASDAVLVAVPMFHANAWGLPFAVPAVGGKLVLPGRHLDGESLARLICSEAVTIAVGVPTVWLALFDHLDAHALEIPSLRRIMVGGAPMPQALMERIERRGIEVQTTWGMTELSPLGTATPPGDKDRNPLTAGQPAFGVDLLVTDENGEPLKRQREAEGHLWVRGPSVVDRYFGQTEKATRGGWFATGDLARIDSAGNLTLTGRSKDLIKSGGEWINPAQIEAAVTAHPDVAMAAVIGREDPKWGERPILLIEPVEGRSPSDADLLSRIRETCPSWWLPDEIIAMNAVPLAATGKIDKLTLRREFGRKPVEVER